MYVGDSTGAALQTRHIFIGITIRPLSFMLILSPLVRLPSPCREAGFALVDKYLNAEHSAVMSCNTYSKLSGSDGFAASSVPQSLRGRSSHLLEHALRPAVAADSTAARVERSHHALSERMRYHPYIALPRWASFSVQWLCRAKRLSVEEAHPKLAVVGLTRGKWPVVATYAACLCFACGDLP